MREAPASPRIVVAIDGRRVAVNTGTSVAAAISIAGLTHCRTSVGGEPRGPFCGMGTCFECRATVNGVAHVRTCQLLCEAAMEIRTR